MTDNILDQIGQAYAALDFSAENKRIDLIEAEIATMHEAIERAEARSSQISSTIREYRGPSGRDAGDAILAGEDTIQLAAPNVEMLEAERASLRAGIKDLLGRIDIARASISAIETECFSAVVKLSAPLVNEIEQQMQAAANAIVSGFAAISAIKAATRSGGDLEWRAREACDAVSGNGRLIPFIRSVPVPEDIFAALRRLDGKGKALPAGFMATVHRR